MSETGKLSLQDRLLKKNEELEQKHQDERKALYEQELESLNADLKGFENSVKKLIASSKAELDSTSQNMSGQLVRMLNSLQGSMTREHHEISKQTTQQAENISSALSSRLSSLQREMTNTIEKHEALVEKYKMTAEKAETFWWAIPVAIVVAIVASVLMALTFFGYQAFSNKPWSGIDFILYEGQKHIVMPQGITLRTAECMDRSRLCMQLVPRPSLSSN